MKTKQLLRKYMKARGYNRTHYRRAKKLVNSMSWQQVTKLKADMELALQRMENEDGAETLPEGSSQQDALELINPGK